MDPAIPVAPLYFSLTAEQRAFFLAELQALREELRKPLPPLPPLQPIPLPPLEVPQSWYEYSNSPAPQEAPEEQAISEEDTEITAEKQEPLYQATVEDDTEDGNNMLVNKSKLSSFSCLCTTRSSGDPAACLSNLLAVLFGSLFGSTSFFGSFLASQLGYIRCMASMEASGEG